jgi:DedD protein
LAESQDVTVLQRRARRRLVGAIALVVLVVVALPIVLDKEPGPIGQDLVIQIPSQDAGKFNTRVLPPSAPVATPPPGAGAEVAVPAKALTPGTAAVPQVAPAAAPAKTEPRAAPADAKAPLAPEPGARKESASPAKGQTPAGKDQSDAVRALALLEGKEAWVVRLGAFSNQDNVRQLQAKLAAAGIKSYTEAVKGPKGDQTRVRAGPFDSKAAAEQARGKIEAMGFRSGTVAPR